MDGSLPLIKPDPDAAMALSGGAGGSAGLSAKPQSSKRGAAGAREPPGGSGGKPASAASAGSPEWRRATFGSASDGAGFSAAVQSWQQKASVRGTFEWLEAAHLILYNTHRTTASQMNVFLSRWQVVRCCC